MKFFVGGGTVCRDARREDYVILSWIDRAENPSKL